MIGKTLTEEQRLQKAVVDIMANPKYIALAGILMIGDRRIDNDAENCPTAYTNGKDERYGRAFVAKLNDAELRFLILHECYHKLYRHLTTWQWMYREHPQAANMACDYVINIKLVDDNKDGFATMTGALKMGCFDEKYRGWDSAKVFKDLKDQSQGNGGQGQGKGQGGQGQGKGQNGAGQGQGQGTGFDDHGWDEAEDMTPSERGELAREIDEAIRQGALMAGKVGSGGDRDFEDLLQPQVDWREALREFISSTCTGSDYSTWRKPNRRYLSAGVYLPSGITERVGELAILIDTSGSTYAPGVLPAFMTEAKSICDTVKPSRVHIIYWDTQVCQAEVYEQDELDGMITSTQPKGGGGTDIRCAIDYMSKQGIAPQASIVLTDGYLGNVWGQWNHPVLWTILDNKNAVPDCGQAVHIKGGDM
jgi:predicted metal-dependent peptidase